jgi:hypothetical protein
MNCSVESPVESSVSVEETTTVFFAGFKHFGPGKELGANATFSLCRKLTECRFFWYLRSLPRACPLTGRPHLSGAALGLQLLRPARLLECPSLEQR